MNNTNDRPAYDVFSAAAWLSDQTFGRSRAVDVDRVEWECTTWGSGRGAGTWEDVGLFSVVAQRFGLDSYANRDERDELVVVIPLDRFDQVSEVIGRLGEDVESWPWLMDEDDDPRSKLKIAANALGLTADGLESDDELMILLGFN